MRDSPLFGVITIYRERYGDGRNPWRYSNVIADPEEDEEMFEERRRRAIDETTPVDWKNAEWLRRFMTENGRILPRRMTGNSQHR